MSFAQQIAIEKEAVTDCDIPEEWERALDQTVAVLPHPGLRSPPAQRNRWQEALRSDRSSTLNPEERAPDSTGWCQRLRLSQAPPLVGAEDMPPWDRAVPCHPKAGIASARCLPAGGGVLKRKAFYEPGRWKCMIFPPVCLR